LTFGLLVAWAVHAAQARVLTAFPRIARAFRVGAYLSGVFSLVLILSVLIQAFHLPVPGLGDLIRAGGPYVLQEHLLITGTWAVLGLLALKRHLPDPLVPTQPPTGATAAVPAAAEPDFEALFRAHGLSGREAAIASLVATGAGNKEIAVRLGISYHTVKNHVASIFRKTGVGNRFELVRFVAAGKGGASGMVADAAGASCPPV
jgi:DNA-binding CsgD family transcriptional regulator